MAKRTFNEAERYVIEHWAASYELEQSMASAREKYQQMCERVVDDILEAHPDFHCPRLRIVHISGNQPGTICIAKKGWLADGKYSCGYWIENIRLEFLCDEDEPSPLLSVWVKPLEKRGDDQLEAAKHKIASEAAKRLPTELLEKASKSFPDNGYAVGYNFVSKTEFLDALADSDTHRFPKLITDHVESLSVLTPVLDELLAKR